MKKQSYTAIISAHKAAIPQIQAAVSALDKSGLTAAGTSIKLLAEGDLVSFRDRAMIIAEEDAKQIKSAHTRKMLTKESLEYMNGVIVDSAGSMRRIVSIIRHMIYREGKLYYLPNGWKIKTGRN